MAISKPQIDFNALNIIIDKPIQRACRQIAIALAREKFNDSKEEFLEKFVEDHTSQEIEEGPEGPLYGFIGFDFDEHPNPIKELYEFLDQSITFNNNPRYDGKTRTYNFEIQVPTMQDIEIDTPMPWGTAVSWVSALEEGISGINHYLFEQNKGRSTGGIQIKGTAPEQQEFEPRPYISPLLKFLQDSLQK